MSATLTTTGLAETYQRLERMRGLGRGYAVRVVTRSTHGTVKRIRSGSEDVSRNAAQNAIIINAQAKAGRKFAFLSTDDAGATSRAWAAGFKDVVRGIGVTAMEQAAAKVGETLIAIYMRHLRNSEGEGGAFASVKPDTQKRKDRETGQTGLPPLIRTGQLLTALLFRARKL